MKNAFNLHQFAEIIRTLFSRLYGGNGAKFYSASNASGERFYTIYVAADATFTSVTGGGGNASSWTAASIPAGTTLTAPVGLPVTAFTLSAGKVACY